MSPEQAMGDKLDGRSDIFSLGVCAFEMLSGEQPFPGTNVTSILYKLVHVDPIEPPNLEMHGLVPQKWHEVFSKVLAKRPDDRYQTATEFVQDLEFCLGSWFGAMGGEETLIEPGGAAPGGAASAEPEDDGATVALKRPSDLPDAPAPKAAPRPAPVAPPVAAPAPAASAPAPAGDDRPFTVKLPIPAAADAVPLTMPLQRPPAAVLSPPPLQPTPSQEKTILMSAPVLPPSPKPAERVAQRPATNSPATIVMTAATAAPRPAEPAAKPIPPPPPTVTVKAAVPAPTVKERSLEDTLKPPKAPAAPVGVVTRAPSPSRALPLGVIVGGAGLLFVVAAIVAGVALLRSPEPAAPEPTPAPTPVVAETPTPEASVALPPYAPGVLHIESEPAGATVTVNGDPRGSTPVDLGDLEVGVYEVKVELKGFIAQTRSVVLSAESPQQDASFTLARVPPAGGLLDVVSTPFGGAVRIDGAPAGETPLTGQKLKTGTHRVEISIEGHQPWSGEVQIEPGKRARVDAHLAPIAVATPVPTPRPDVVDTTQVYLPNEVDTAPRKMSGTVSYPGNAPKLRSGESASVSVSFVVTDEGEVTDPKIMESGGRILDEVVLAAVRGWKYTPGVKKGVPVKVRMTVKQTFRAG
jgi:TonB family protein